MQPNRGYRGPHRDHSELCRGSSDGRCAAGDPCGWQELWGAGHAPPWTGLSLACCDIDSNARAHCSWTLLDTNTRKTSPPFSPPATCSCAKSVQGLAWLQRRPHTQTQLIPPQAIGERHGTTSTSTELFELPHDRVGDRRDPTGPQQGAASAQKETWSIGAWLPYCATLAQLEQDVC